MARIIPIRTGWDPHPADPEGYPDDLPEDWRLGYFANTHWGVLVPAPRWTRADGSELESWVQDTPDRFRFYLDSGPEWAAALDPGALGRAALGLGPRLAALVGGPGAPPPGLHCHALVREGPAPTQATGGDLSGGPPGGPGGDGPAWILPAPLVGDLPGARRWIERRQGELAGAPPAGPVPILLGHCRLADLGRWQTLVELMGLA
jgi:hypothetical protein